MPQSHYLDASEVHYTWDRNLSPRLVIDSGDSIVFETRDASDFYYTSQSTSSDVARQGPFSGHPLTGPVRMRDAVPGDVLAVEILSVNSSKGFAWTTVKPGRGLLPTEDFSEPFLQIWDLDDDGFARMRQRDDVAVPIAPFPGIMGTALSAPGAHSTMPPRENGGNMDIRHLCGGSTLFLPVWVEGALFSVGDAHAAQGDGEVCITAMEMAATVELRLSLQKGRNIAEPQFHTHGPLCPGYETSGYFVTTAQGPDLYANAQQALRYLIDHLVRERGLSREEAYVLCSVCVDLKINEIVDAPNWIVSASFPEIVLRRI
jgi:acetamidase/formamidase